LFSLFKNFRKVHDVAGYLFNLFMGEFELTNISVGFFIVQSNQFLSENRNPLSTLR
jgi:hypothetical protein